MTQQQALALFDQDVSTISDSIVNQDLQVQLQQWQFDALADLAFNVLPATFDGTNGKSPLLADINSGKCDPATIQADFALMPGDPTRRANDANLFINGIYPPVKQWILQGK